MIKDRYELIRQLGAGGMGTVWMAQDTMLGRRVALKRITLTGGREAVETQRQRALREARAAASVHHPAVVPVYDWFLDDADGAPWIVMAYIEGTTLEQWIEAGRRTEHEVAALARQVLGGLMAVHRVGVLHRDIKPANIVVTRDQQVCLVDFGIARIVGESGVTATGLLLGTVEYMAPERVNDGAQSPAADLWSFGVTFVHALEGYSPFRRGGVPATFFAILKDPLPAPRRPGPLYDALTTVLQKDPGRRIDAHGLAARLDAVLAPSAPKPAKAPPKVPHRVTPAPKAADPPPRRSPVTPREVARPGPESVPYARMEPRRAAEEIDGLATSRPDQAATTLTSLPADRAGRVLGLMRPDGAAAVLRLLSPAQGARLLAHTSERTAGTLVGMLGVTAPATRLLEAMTLARACAVLEHVVPAVVAGLLEASSDGRAGRLLKGLSPEVRARIVQIDRTDK
ncbi:protein kinase domain-containing protein [Herbidospora mongoliensis]|uniref:protein kinase domain-containing protein n=1 Tax=Herbidospora mongoliensis TaxID=688067 RepID=UPI000830AD52|nr:protein kinase [Herbidospora mongoliensis]